MALISTTQLPLSVRQPPLPSQPSPNASPKVLNAHIATMHQYAAQQQQQIQKMYNDLHTVIEGYNLVGLAADLPTAGFPGRQFYATDTGAYYKDSGSAWVQVGGAASATTFVGAITSPYTLPASTGSMAQYIIKNLTGGSLTVDPHGADTIDGSASYVLSLPNQAATFVDYGSGTWAVV